MDLSTVVFNYVNEIQSNTHFLYQYFVFMSCTARRDTSHIETLVSPLTNLLVSSIPDQMGKMTRQGGMGKFPPI